MRNGPKMVKMMSKLTHPVLETRVVVDHRGRLELPAVLRNHQRRHTGLVKERRCGGWRRGRDRERSRDRERARDWIVSARRVTGVGGSGGSVLVGDGRGAGRMVMACVCRGSHPGSVDCGGEARGPCPDHDEFGVGLEDPDSERVCCACPGDVNRACHRVATNHCLQITTVTAQSQHSHSTVTAQSQHSHRG